MNSVTSYYVLAEGDRCIPGPLTIQNGMFLCVCWAMSSAATLNVAYPNPISYPMGLPTSLTLRIDSTPRLENGSATTNDSSKG
ncbi:hypothetical protein evm_014789 [Chilo suppressalis]|nr:hypothetical protein evm_014789 [Chilo suppressalis]